MLSCTDQWHFTIDNLVVNTGAGKTKIETYMKELKYWGYLKLEKQNRDKGRFGNCDYIVSEYGNLDNPF